MPAGTSPFPPPTMHANGNSLTDLYKAMAAFKAAGNKPSPREIASQADRMRPVVGDYHAIYPSPLTLQYGVTKDMVENWKIAAETRWCSTLEPFGTWGRASLANVCDVARMNWKERLSFKQWQWCFIHADGWQLNFWDENFWLHKDSDNGEESRVNPIASLDIRIMFSVNVKNEPNSEEGYRCPWEVQLNFKTGFFTFRVKSEEEAQAWNVRIMQGVVQSVKISQMHQQYMHNLHLHDEAEPFRIEKDPERARQLRQIWHAAISAIEKGIRPPKKIFMQLYQLYDALDVNNYQIQLPHHAWGAPTHADHHVHMNLLADQFAANDEGDGNLTMAEIEVMAKELLDMKYQQIKSIVIAQEQVLYSTHRPPSAYHEVKLKWTIQQGRELMERYERMMEPSDFFDRVVNFHHRTDFSRDGKVDVREFINSAPVFLMPFTELKKEGLFFRSAEESEPKKHIEHEEETAKLRKEGKTRQQAEAECNQQ